MKTHHSRIVGLGALLATLSLTLSSCSLVNSDDAGSTEKPSHSKTTPESKHTKSGKKPSGLKTFKGTTWIARDGSEMVFGEDGILSWYREEGVHDGDLFEGPYEAYRGQDAYDFIVEDLKDYGVTPEELDRILSAKENDLDNLVVYTLEHQKVISDGELYDFDNRVVPYYGSLYDNDSRMEVVNMDTGTPYYFTKK